VAKAFVTRIPVALPPDLVRAWWTDIDPATVVSREAGGTLHVQAKFGAFPVTETFRVRGDGSWGFVTSAPFGVEVLDDFRVASTASGSLVEVTCEVRGRTALGKLVAPCYRPFARRQFRRQWRDMARQCERDAAAPS